MAKQVINIGTVAGDGTGDPIRSAFGKSNANFTELYDGLDSANVAIAAKLSPNGDGSALTGLTKAQVSLGNVDNTSDNNKPVSTAQQTALDGKQPLDATLTSLAALVWSAGVQIPVFTGDNVVSFLTIGQGTNNILNKEAGDVLYSSVSHTHTKTDVGLGNVDNTSDANKPISTAMLTALDAKQAKDIIIATQTGTAYTAVLTDAGTYIRFTNSAANTFTVPANASVSFPIGTIIFVVQAGTGSTTVVADSGVTIHTSQTLVARAQYSAMKLVKVATNEWDISGDLTP